MNNFYITTTIPYVNANPHLGHALEMVQADAIARYHRLSGQSVFFSTGTDEHGQKISEGAQKENLSAQEYANKYAKRFYELKNVLSLSNDAFIRTTDEYHKSAAQELWRLCDKSGDIYKDIFEGLYCVGCEKYLTERDLKDGRCPYHSGCDPEKVKEENYFFRLSKYKDQLLEYLEKDSIIPKVRKKEAINFVEDGLADFSISRRKERLSWGVEVPGDSEHVMYVWFDALTNYISTLGWPGDEENKFNKFWQEGHTVQMAGKDQVRFQSIMWQAMLFSADIKPTDQIFYHGFITSGGQKMSKSIGNVVNPFDVQKEYDTDALRYFLLHHIHPFDDSDFTDERMKDSYNGHLANGLGNVVARTMKMAIGYDVDFEEISFNEYHSFIEQDRFEEYREAFESFHLNEAVDFVWALIAFMDSFIDETKPFKTIKTDPERAKRDVLQLIERLWEVAVLLSPLMPDTAGKIQSAIKTREIPENLFPRK